MDLKNLSFHHDIYWSQFFQVFTRFEDELPSLMHFFIYKKAQIEFLLQFKPRKEKHKYLTCLLISLDTMCFTKDKNTQFLHNCIWIWLTNKLSYKIYKL